MATRTTPGKRRAPSPRPDPSADPLAEMVRAAGLGEAARTALVQALAHQLAEDHFARLDQAGHSDDDGIPLRRVFIDLFTAEQSAESSPSKKGFVSQLLAARPAPVGADPLHEPQPRRTSRLQRCSGFVLIGGPGQGKSTLGQLACQTHRAALLRESASFLTTQERTVLADFIDPAAQRELGVPAHPSMPVRIVLPEVAAWLTEQQQEAAKAPDSPPQLPWLLRFWHSRLTESARRALRPEDLLALLRAGPFLLVLDGLDEVPAAGARARVLSAVRDLGIALAGAPGLVLATTRPQGYAGELDGLGLALQTRHLAPLTPERALVYAGRLAVARIPEKEERTKLLERMREASTESATRRLMTTPLQVTILAALLRKGGRPPRERWSLFKRYYDVMFARELTKPTDAADLLSTYKEHIYNIHARAGLLLQVESENAERTEALLSRERLEAITDAVLSEEGFQAAQRPALIERIVAAAAHRLVFLVQPQEGKFGFEIRSLQEFMAAAALAQKSEAATRARLTHVARAGSFRNVTLFLTGKLLSETGDLRDAIAGEVCPALERDTLSKAAKAGAVLALEILEDGAAMSQPRRAEDLMRLALGVLDLAPHLLQVRLAELLLGEKTPAHAALEPLVRDGIQARLTGESPIAQLSAWIALLRLVAEEKGGPAWAVSLADNAWPEDGAAQRAIVETVLEFEYLHDWNGLVSTWLVERIGASLQHFGWSTVEQLSRQLPFRVVPERETPIWSLFIIAGAPNPVTVPVLLGGKPVHHFTWRSVRPYAVPWQDTLSRLPSVPLWQAFSAVKLFEAQPSIATLVRALRALAESSPHERRSLGTQVPWLLCLLLESTSSAEELRELAERALGGRFGDAATWARIEKEWSKGIELDDLLAAMNPEPLTWTADSLRRGPPLLDEVRGILDSASTSHYQSAIRFLLGQRNTTPALTKAVASVLAFGNGARLEPVFAEMAPATLITLLQNMTGCRASVLVALTASPSMPAVTLDTWARRRSQVYYWSDEEGCSAALMSALALMYASDPSLHGLLHLLAQVAEAGVTAEIPPAVLDRARFEDPLLRADAWLLRLQSGAVHLDDTPTLLQDATAAAEREPGYLSRVLRTTEWGALDPTVRDSLLAAIHASPSDIRAASYALGTMLHHLQLRPSGLDDPDTWSRLELPLPHPTPSPPPPPSAWPLTAPPIHLQKLVLQNVRSLEHLTLDLTFLVLDSAPAPARTPHTPLIDHGQWTVLLGENGMGKTTILRAIVLALRNLSDPQIWPKGTFAPAWRRQGANPETDTCRVLLGLAGGSTYETTIRQNGKEVFFQSPARSAAALAPCLLWAYGCRRGSALGGESREVDVSDDDGPDIATLFDERASLIHAQSWLQKLLLEATRDSARARPIYDAVIGALKSILDLEDIDFDSESNVVVSGAGVGKRVPLAALSDGYLTTAGWLLDLLARWIARARQAGLAIGADFPEKMTGLVLLDEIDLHLHPAWQLEVIPRVRAIFKRLSFVVTTHNPLTIVGARPEEIWVLQRDANGVRAERRPDIPATLTAAQIYARFFGIEGFFPAPLGRQLQRYGFLCGNAYRSEDDQREMEALRAELAKAGITPGWQELPRRSIDEKPLLLDPAVEHGVCHIEFVPWSSPRLPRPPHEQTWRDVSRWMASPRAGSERGRSSIDVLDLNHDQLQEHYLSHVRDAVTPCIDAIREAILGADAGRVRKEVTRAQLQLLTRSVPHVGLSYDALRYFVPPRRLAPFRVAWPAPSRVGSPPPSRRPRRAAAP